MIAHLSVSVGLSNTGRRLGHITDFRARAFYKDAPFIDAYENFRLIGEQEFSTRTKRPLYDSTIGYGAPFALLGGETIDKILLFNRRWNNQIKPGQVAFVIEALIGESGRWQQIGEWNFFLANGVWECLEAGDSFILRERSRKAADEIGDHYPDELPKYLKENS